MTYVTSLVSWAKASHMATSKLKWVRKCHLTMCLDDYLTGAVSGLEDNKERGVVFSLGELTA